MNLEKLKGLGDEEVMKAYIKEAETVSFEGNFGEAYDKEWALKDEGKREGIELSKKEIAKNMLKKNIDKSLILELTNLTEEELTALEEE